MNAHSRRTRILEWIADQGELQVTALADLLGASLNTIRNDLDTLAAEGLLQRVRGGAARLGAPLLDGRPLALNGAHEPPLSPIATLAAALPVSAHPQEKESIGAWAATLVRDGDALVLDGSSTVYRMATHLRDRRNLTVITNGLLVGLLLAQEPTNKVILAANELRTQGGSVVGRINPELLRHFYASRAFISCAGFSLDQGLTESSVDEGLPKREMMPLAREVIALVDSSKVGAVHAYRFADVHQVHHLVVDEGIDAAALQALRLHGDFPVTVTSLGAALESETHAPAVQARGRKRRIGFGNMTEKMLFAQQVRRSLERALRNHEDVELLVRDNDLDRNRSLANVDWFIKNQIELMIEYQVDAEAGNIIMDRFNRAGIPVIAVDIPLPGATFFGADNYRAGFMAGEALGAWILTEWQGRLDRLLRLEAPVVGPPGARIQGQQEGLESVLGQLAPHQVMAVDSPVLVDEAAAVVARLLPTIPAHDRIALVGINDEAVLGALAAFEAAGRLEQVIAVGQNGDRLGRAALRRNNFPFLGCTAYFPERYGEQLISLALRLLRGEPTPPALYSRHVFLTAANLEEHYPAASDELAEPLPALMAA
jgi:ribose transport system substrate-binding protein